MPCPPRFELPEGYNGVLVRDCFLEYVTVHFSNLEDGPLIMQLSILISSFLNFFKLRGAQHGALAVVDSNSIEQARGRTGDQKVQT